MTLFRNRVSAVVKDLEMQSSQVNYTEPKHDGSCFNMKRRGRFEMQRRPGDRGGKDASGVATSQGPPGTTGSWERQGRVLP